uniref:(northern house mosquito) hypothetical protein n=1 Tax=Culex pipiens TaxID=7175 RepID=A0A8D8BG21_CULPI
MYDLRKDVLQRAISDRSLPERSHQRNRAETETNHLLQQATTGETQPARVQVQMQGLSGNVSVQSIAQRSSSEISQWSQIHLRALRCQLQHQTRAQIPRNVPSHERNCLPV